MRTQKVKTIGFDSNHVNFNEGLVRIRLLLVSSVAAAIIASCAFPAAAQVQEQNTDRVGRDYKNFEVNVPPPGSFSGPVDICRETCQRDGNCKAWTLVKAGIQGTEARCWLKNAIPAASANNCCVSGVPVRSFEPDVDRPGSDYNSFDLASADPNLCKAACENDGLKCKAWSFVKPGVQGPKPRFWVKNAIPPAFTNNCCTSGVRETIVH
jgi:hypothetical protein